MTTCVNGQKVGVHSQLGQQRVQVLEQQNSEDKTEVQTVDPAMLVSSSTTLVCIAAGLAEVVAVAGVDTSSLCSFSVLNTQLIARERERATRST